MFRHVIAPVRSYTKAANEVVRHRRLNSDAKVLLLYVQGLPEAEADKSLGEHADDLGMRPREYQRAKKALAAGGYLYEWKTQDHRGHWSTSQFLSNITLTREEAAALRNGVPAREGEGTGGPSGANPAVGSPRARSVGGLPPGDEDWGKTFSHPPTEEPSAEEPSAEEPPIEEPSAEEPPVEKPPVEKPSVEEPSVEEPSVEEPSAGPEVETAERLLLSLRHESRELLLGVREARGLAGAAAEWLRRGVSVAELRHALTAHLPAGGVRSAAGFLRHRLTEKLPAPVPRPERPEGTPAASATVRVRSEIVLCEGPGSDHTFRRVGDETHCGPCRREAARRQYAHRHPEPDGKPVSWRDRFGEYARGAVS
ncbi:hypothetical protein [Streptomyces sp. NPDC001744]|uniref:hypothetical protein n=1 Tax=Streptomyces sp. NPDC001744 TaxID=3364606 RepID=UPI003681DF9F